MYLKRRGEKWWAFHDIPADCQGALGEPGRPRRRFAQRLDTEDKTDAQVRGAALEIQWRTLIKLARGQGNLDDRAKQIHWLQTQVSNEPEHKAILAGIERAEYERLGLFRVAGHPDDTPAQAAALERFTKISTGALTKLDAHLDEYLKTRKGEEKSLAMKASTIRKFCEAFPYVADVRRKRVQEWVNLQAEKGASKRKGEDGAAPATIRRMLSEIRGYWDYLVSIEEAPEAIRPFEKLSLSSARKNGKRRAFTPADVVKVLAEARRKNDHPLADLIQVLMYTGARIEQACTIKTKHVNLVEGYIDIPKTMKSETEPRVPIHHKLKPVIKRLMGEGKDDFLLSGLGANKYGDRAGAIGKRGNRLIHSLGFDQNYVLHSIRRTVTTMLEQAGIDNSVIKDIQSWDRKDDMVGGYTEGTSLDQRRQAIKELKYPGQ